MGTFTITTTITGRINGRTLNVENVFELEEVARVITDDGYVGLASGGMAQTFQASAVGVRAQHAENSVAFACFAPTNPYATQVVIGEGANSYYINAALAPMIFHHGEDWNGSVNAATSTPPADPTAEITYFGFRPYAPFEYRAIALLKPVS